MLPALFICQIQQHLSHDKVLTKHGFYFLTQLFLHSTTNSLKEDMFTFYINRLLQAC